MTWHGAAPALIPVRDLVVPHVAQYWLESPQFDTTIRPLLLRGCTRPGSRLSRLSLSLHDRELAASFATLDLSLLDELTLIAHPHFNLGPDFHLPPLLHLRRLVLSTSSNSSGCPEILRCFESRSHFPALQTAELDLWFHSAANVSSMPRWLLALAHSWTARETDTLEVLADVKSFTPRTLRFEGHLFDNEGFGSFSRVVPRMRGLEELLLRNAGSGVFTDIAPPPPPFQAVRIGSVEIVDVRDLRAWDVDRARRSWMRNPPLRFVVDDHVDFHMHSLSTAADVRKGLEMVSFLRELGMLDGPEIRGLTELEELAAWDV